jgi:sulfhydrogenase subunit alpha
MKRRTIKVDYLARVEGEGSLLLKIHKGAVTEAKLKIFEPPRFFEGFMRGRDYTEAPDITARICGICPVAYQMSSVHAMENALGITVDGQLRELRRLLYCGEWIESHVLHIYFLHAPDFLGYQDAIRMAKDHGEAVQTALKLKKIGNEIMTVVGGREIHPVNVRVGGFYRLPSPAELQPLIGKLEWARETALDAVRWTASLPFPDFEQDYEFVALRHPDEYPINEGRVVSSKGIDIAVKEYESYFIEEHVRHSHALASTIKDRGAYFVGPLARYNLNFDKLGDAPRKAALDAGLTERCANPFKSIIVRAVELVYACDEALRIIRNYRVPPAPFIPGEPRAAVGMGCTEAPRGLLYHRYKLDQDGSILEAKIVPPTAQNQKIIESDLKHYAAKHLDLSDEALTWQCEQTVRNYDPCISCATHYLRVNIERD